MVPEIHFLFIGDLDNDVVKLQIYSDLLSKLRACTKLHKITGRNSG